MSAVKVVLDNEMYEGRVIWNRREWVKHPETGKRTYRMRAKEEWVVKEMPSLRIVAADVIASVRRRQESTRKRYSQACPASAAQRHLFSGLLVCAQCGGSVTIVKNSSYGCGTYKARGDAVCTNRKTVSRRIVETVLLRNIKSQLREPANVKLFQETVSRILTRQNGAEELARLAELLRAAERVQRNVLEAIKRGIVTDTTMEAMESADAEVAAIKRRLADIDTTPVETMLPRVIDRYRHTVNELERSLENNVEPARDILRSLLGERIRLHVRNEYLEAEIPNHVPALMAMSLNWAVDSGGCGGPICRKSTFVPLRLHNGTPHSPSSVEMSSSACDDKADEPER